MDEISSRIGVGKGSEMAVLAMHQHIIKLFIANERHKTITTRPHDIGAGLGQSAHCV